MNPELSYYEQEHSHHSSLSRKNIFSIIFNHNNLNTSPMELEFAIYFLSPDGFSFVVSTHFLHTYYEDPCLIT